MTVSTYQPGVVLAGTVYRVIRHIATGGMGSVYEVEDTTVEKRYVLKTLHPQFLAREDLARRMRDEAKALAKLSHPNIVEVITAGITTDAQKVPFYVMERLTGQNLRTIIEKRGALALPHAYRIAIEMADALDHAHTRSIIHRDVKPENIFLHRNQHGSTTTKLLDFGIVRLLDREASQTHGKFLGTLRYASPEQVKGNVLTPSTDLYSLGVVLFEMLCGCGPFDDAGDAYAIGSAHAHDPAPPVSRFVRVPSDLERLVASALAKNPVDRPHTAASFATELRRLLHEEEATPRSNPTIANALTAMPSSAAPTLDPTELAPPAATETAPGLRTTPLPIAPPVPAGHAVDRNAATRLSTPRGQTQRLAANDTRMHHASSPITPAPPPSQYGAYGSADPSQIPPSEPPRADKSQLFFIVAAALILTVLLIAGAVILAKKTAGGGRDGHEHIGRLEFAVSFVKMG